jgi:hypothetical protein
MLKNPKNTAERRSLGFSKEARELFSFLEVQWEFKCVRQENTFVRYESADVYVNVYHGRSSFEIGVEIGNKSSEHSFNLEALVALFDKELSLEYWAAGGRTAKAVRRALKKQAEGLSRYGGSALSGHQSIFDRLEQLRTDRSAAMVLDSKAYQIRPKAEAAFRSGDYKEAVKLYSSIEAALSPIERKKLQLAKNKAASY